MNHTVTNGSGPLLATKLYKAPPRTNLVFRARLIRQLTEGLDMGCRLVLISAPAGFGKTTLVSDWLGHLKSNEDGPNVSKTAWLSLDEGDNDPARFLLYLMAALQNIDPIVGRTIQQSPQLPPPDVLGTALVNDLAVVQGKLALVLDDYHLIGNSYVHELVEFLVEHQPPHMHLVLTGREDPPLPLSRLRARGQIVEIRQEDLRFTPKETATFLNQTMNLELTPDMVATLERRTEGWIAGLQLAGLSLQGRDKGHVVDFIQAFSGSHRYVIDYLIEEVILQQPKNIRRFLQQTAILERFSAPLCNAVTKEDSGRIILNYLDQVNLFLIPLDEERHWYRYHHLFAEFLQTELSSNAQQALHQRAALWFDQHNFPEEAIKHALAAEDFALAGRIIIDISDIYLHNSKLITLNRWLAAMPDELVKADSHLATAKGWVTWLLGHVEESAVYAKAAEANLPAGVSPVSRGKLLSLQACLTISRNPSSFALAEAALPLLEEADPFYVGITLLVLGEMQSLLGDSSGAIETFQEGYRLGLLHRDEFSIMGAAANLAQQLNWQGKRREAIALCQAAMDACVDADGRPLPIAGLGYFTLSDLEFHAGKLELARDYVHKGKELGLSEWFVGFDISGRLALAQVLHAQGQPDEALANIQAIRHLVAEGHFDSYQSIIAALEANQRLKMGHIQTAATWAKGVTLPTNTEKAMGPFREFELLTYARLLLADNQPQAALDVLEYAEKSARLGNRNLLLIFTYLRQAKALLALDQMEPAVEKLSQALKLAAPESYCQLFLEEDDDVRQWLAQLRHVAPQFVDDLLQAAGQPPATVSPAAPPPAVQPAVPPPTALIEPLTEREIEVLQLVAAGHSNKTAAKKLIVTVGTVKKHLSNVFGKLQVNSRTQAVARARELGLIP